MSNDGDGGPNLDGDSIVNSGSAYSMQIFFLSGIIVHQGDDTPYCTPQSIIQAANAPLAFPTP